MPAGWVGHSLLCRLAESLRAARLSTNLARTRVLSAYSGQLYRLTTYPPPPQGETRPPADLAGHPSAGFPATAASLRGFPADSRAGSARDGKKPAVVTSNTSIDLQGFYGSDGTRTRDLRRDRPVMALAG